MTASSAPLPFVPGAVNVGSPPFTRDSANGPLRTFTRLAIAALQFP